MGGLEQGAGNLPAARERFEASLRIQEELAAGEGAPEIARRDVGITLRKLAEVQRQQGDLEGARVRLEQSLRIDEELARASATSSPKPRLR